MDKPSARKPSPRWRLAALAAILLLGAAAMLLWPRPPILVPYVSPPFDAQGTRVRLLVPQGWEVRLTPKNSRTAYLEFGPRDRFPRWPAWLRWIFHVEPEPAVLGVMIAPYVPTPDSLDHESPGSGLNGVPYGMYRWMSSSDRRFLVEVDYWRSNKAVLDATRRAIFDSVRVGR
jgi:hypothetical protein